MGFKLNKLCEKANVKGMGKQVLSKLCDHASPSDNYQCWPSNKTLASETGRSVRSIQRAIKSLKDSEYIFIKKRKWSDGSFPSNLYTINLEKLYSDSGYILEQDNGKILQFPK